MQPNKLKIKTQFEGRDTKLKIKTQFKGRDTNIYLQFFS